MYYKNNMYTVGFTTVPNMVKNLLSGTWCIATSCSWMIYTSVYYLSLLDYTIPDFNVQEFNPDTTHR